MTSPIPPGPISTNYVPPPTDQNIDTKGQKIPTGTLEFSAKISDGKNETEIKIKIEAEAINYAPRSFLEKIKHFVDGKVKIVVGTEAYLVKARDISKILGVSRREISKDSKLIAGVDYKEGPNRGDILTTQAKRHIALENLKNVDKSVFLGEIELLTDKLGLDENDKKYIKAQYNKL